MQNASSFLWVTINALRDPLQLPATICSYRTQARDGPVLLRRKAASYKASFSRIAGKGKQAVVSHFWGLLVRFSEITLQRGTAVAGSFLLPF